MAGRFYLNTKQNESAIVAIWLAVFVPILAICAAISYFCVNYCLETLFHKDIPWYADIVLGFLLNGLLIPATIIT